MCTRSSSNLQVVSSPNPATSNPKRRNRRRSKQPFILEESLIDTMTDQRTMAELLRAPTEGYAEAIVVPRFLLGSSIKHSFINMMTSDQFFGLEKDNPHDHIRWSIKITSTIKYKDVPNSVIKLMLFPFSLAGAARQWLEKEPPRSILTWEDLLSKFINEFFLPSRTTNLHNEISNFQQPFDESFHEAWYRYKDLRRACPHHGFTELHQLDTVYNALNPADQDSFNSAAGGNLLKRRTQEVLTIIENKSKVCNSRNKSIVSQVKSSDANSSSSEIAKLTHAVNQQTSDVTTTMTAILKQFKETPPPAFVKAVEVIYVTCGGAHPYYQCLTAGGNTFLELRDNIQGYVAAAVVNYNKGSGHLPSKTIANPKGELKAITTQSGIVLDGPFVPIPPPFINPKEDERVEETLTDQDLAVDHLHPNIPYPSRMHKQNQQEKEVQIQKFCSPFQQGETFRTGKHTLNENCLAVNLKKLPEKLGHPGKFLILCGFSELKCKALADLANRAICTSAGIGRDVFVPVGKFTFLTGFVTTDYESDPRVPFILGRPFLWTARALIDVHGEEMILRDGDERLTLNMRHDTSSYSNQPQKESINMINIYEDSSEDFLENLFATNHRSGNPTFSCHSNLTSLEVKDDVFDPKGGNVLPEKLLDLDSTTDLHPPHNINPLSGSTTSSSPNQLLKEFIDELALITFLPGNDDLPFDIDHFLSYSDYDSFLFEEFSKVDALPSTNNDDKVFNPGILIREKFFEVITRVAPNKNDKKLAISHASLILEDFNPPLYELPFFKERIQGSTKIQGFYTKSFAIEAQAWVYTDCHPGNPCDPNFHQTVKIKVHQKDLEAIRDYKYGLLAEVPRCNF
uniref:Reverse transcriptase domain-containing protein n=1 Tax=Tanacetum cinerariifolium TaxID=118510 RepID=A0A699H8Q7_TANCI|nr:reverse transcriptase domain-containing protein [Tanacetum cinerariifolium]